MQRLAFDIGGTFTDYVLHEKSTGRIRIWKVLTTREPESGVEATLAQKIAEGELTFDQACSVVHAITVAAAARERYGDQGELGE